MKIRTRAACGAVCASIALAGVVSLSSFPLPGQAQVARSSQLRGQVRYNRISPPEAGVELLEKIFSRVMNLPQIAMANQSPMQQLQVVPEAKERELLIRPKEKAKTLYTPQSPSLRFLPTPTPAGFGLDSSSGDDMNFAPQAESFSNRPQQVAGSLPPTAHGRYVHQAADSISNRVETWQGSQLAKNKDSFDRSGVWDRGDASEQDGASLVRQFNSPSQQAAAPSASPAPAPASLTEEEHPRRRAKGQDLASAISNLAGVTKKMNEKMDEVRKLEESRPVGSQQAQDKAPPVVTASDSKTRSNWYQAQRQIQVLDERPAVRDYRNTQAKLPANAMGARIINMDELQAQAGKSSQPGSSNYSRAQGYSQNYAGAGGALSSSRAVSVAGTLSQKLTRSEPQERKLIALLPPTVATGIPLVSLGTSQKQVMPALTRMGQLKEQSLGSWTVITWKKKDEPGAPSTTSLQLYFRHGLLDAIRIYDPSLIAPDFGVSPGDSLERMKQKFGEPAFLLEEPKMTGSQNYIYPISQVGFQLARRNPDADPQVVSILIFSVK